MSTAVALASLSDADLIARVVAGSHEDFEVLVRRHNQRLFRAARAIVKADDEDEDVAQQTWRAEGGRKCSRRAAITREPGMCGRGPPALGEKNAPAGAQREK